MCPALPSEIWLQIASFLSESALLPLYAVNRTFYDLAMNIKYQELELKLVNETVLEKLDCMRNPSIARRIKSITVDLVAFHVWPTVQISTDAAPVACEPSSRRWFGLFKRRRNQLSPVVPPSSDQSTPRSCHDDLITRLRDVVALAPNVRRLKLVVRKAKDELDEVQLRLVECIWRSLQPDGLTSLSFESPVDCVIPLLGRFLGYGYHFKLQALSVSINSAPLGAHCIFIAGFINRYVSSLRDLIINFWTYTNDCSFDKFFDYLGTLTILSFVTASLTLCPEPFPHLVNVSLDLPYTPQSSPRMIAFLNSHCPSLRTLSLNPRVYEQQYAVASITPLRLPQLHSLTLVVKFLNKRQIEALWSGHMVVCPRLEEIIFVMPSTYMVWGTGAAEGSNESECSGLGWLRRCVDNALEPLSSGQRRLIIAAGPHTPERLMLLLK